MIAQDSETMNAGLEITRTDASTLQLELTGSWRLRDTLPSIDAVTGQLSSTSATERITISSDGITHWDTGLLIFISKLKHSCQQNQLQIELDGLPAGIRKLLNLASSFPAPVETDSHEQKQNLFSRIGNSTLDLFEAAPDALRFLGASLKAIVRLATGKAQYNHSEMLYIVQQVGPRALPIVSLISFLVGLILAYMGALQLERFGAQIYVADLVGIAMVREIGALMTAIIMAGRTGAAYAAELGSMQVNEEIDAYKTLGISPIDYLVMPRLLALVLMMPLLSLYAGLVGIVAGVFISVSVFDLSVYEYYQQTLRALNFTHFSIGMMKGTLYGVLIALAGCLRGMQCGRSAQAVGQATTSAVVTGIISIVIAASLTTVILQKLGI